MLLILDGLILIPNSKGTIFDNRVLRQPQRGFQNRPARASAGGDGHSSPVTVRGFEGFFYDFWLEELEAIAKEIMVQPPAVIERVKKLLGD
jgi:hypothetical protein